MKAAKRKEQHKKKSASHKPKKEIKEKSLKDWDDMDKDVKERSKERKKTVEENKGKTDMKKQAMNALKARREEKRERGKYSSDINDDDEVLTIDIWLSRRERKAAHRNGEERAQRRRLRRRFLGSPSQEAEGFRRLLGRQWLGLGLGCQYRKTRP